MRVTPWRDLEEWLFIKQSFFPSEPNDDLARKFAVDRVEAWSVRGRVPHAVVSTAMLSAAMIKDRASLLTTLESRMILAMALVRFVNGFLDPAQQAAYAVSMSALAKTIKLPEAFVEIRHSATHDSLPSLPTLRAVLVNALNWLWDNYWDVPPAPSPKTGQNGHSLPVLSDRLDSILRSWRKCRKSDPSRPVKKGDADPDTKMSLLLLKELSSIPDTPSNASLLACKLLRPKLLLSLNNAVTVWTPFLEHAAKNLSQLLNALVLQGNAILASGYPISELDSITWRDRDWTNIIKNEQDFIPNVEGSYERLQSWVNQFIDMANGTGLDVPSISKALCFYNDQYTLHIMHKLQDIPTYQAIVKPLLSIRLGEQILDKQAYQAESKQEHYDQSSKEDNKIKLEDSQIRSGSWRRFQPAHDLPLGWLVS